MELEKKIRQMNRFLLECNLYYYSNDKLRYNFEDLELAIHPSWTEFRKISDAKFDALKREYLETSLELHTLRSAEQKLFLDFDNETHLYIALNMCKKAVNPVTWPGRHYPDTGSDLHV